MDAAASKDLGVSPRENWTRVGLLHFRAAATAWVCHCLDRGLDDPYFAPATPVLAPENLIFSHGHRVTSGSLGKSTRRPHSRRKSYEASEGMWITFHFCLLWQADRQSRFFARNQLR